MPWVTPAITAKLRAACELSASREEAKERATQVYLENKLEFEDDHVSVVHCIQVTLTVIWPDVERERKKIYLGFQFI